MSYLSLANLTKRFGSNTVVDDFNLDVRQGEFLSFLGPSGCGKTTVLRMVAGFDTPTSGSIRIEGQDITHLPPNKRRIGMVFQAYALFPNMTVAENVSYGLRIAGQDKSAIRARLAEMLELIKLDHLGDRYPYQLSGGQQQRVALARALAPRPRLLLLDEPLSALDAKVRVALRDDIRAIQRELGITAIFVTHDQEEALSISDRVAVMHQGRADQIGTPNEVYSRPATSFVAGFVGQLNTFEARLEADGTVTFAGCRFNAPDRMRDDLAAVKDDVVAVALRPEAVSLRRRNERDATITGRVLHVDFMGAVLRARVDVGGRIVAIDMFNRKDALLPQAGAEADLFFSPDDLIVLPK